MPGMPSARNAHLIADAAVGWHVLLGERVIRGHADAVQHCDLLVERHLLDDQVGALVGERLVFIHGPVGLGGCWRRCEKPGRN
jgi:hypothetical protein